LAEAGELSIGSSLDLHRRYTLVELRGRGNYGIVYKAVQKGLERNVAIKILRKGVPGDKIQHLKREGWLQGQLSHPNIVDVHDLDEETGALVLEYVDMSLHEKLQQLELAKKTFEPAQALQIIRKCLEGLAHAHDKGVVHGDLKPANILISNNLEEVKISDFGVARIFGTAEVAAEGSDTCAAPEVLRSWKERGVWSGDYSSDLFSLGIIAYVILYGKHPFLRSGMVSPRSFIMHHDYSPDELTAGEEIPARYVKLIRELLVKERSQRQLTSARQALYEISPETELDLRVKLSTSPGPSSTTASQAQILQAAELQSMAFELNDEGSYFEAEERATEALKLDPRSAPAYHTRGFSRSRQGRLKEAVLDFDKALELTPASAARPRAKILYNRAFAKMKMGDYAGSCSDIKQAQKLDLDDPKIAWLLKTVCNSHQSTAL